MYVEYDGRKCLGRRRWARERRCEQTELGDEGHAEVMQQKRVGVEATGESFEVENRRKGVALFFVVGPGKEAGETTKI